MRLMPNILALPLWDTTVRPLKLIMPASLIYAGANKNPQTFISEPPNKEDILQVYTSVSLW